MRIAYADPPYPGEAYIYKRRNVNHERLIQALCRFDGWALSTKSTALRELLPICPTRARVGCWCKGRSGNGAVMNPSYSWEPVIFVCARQEQLDRWRGGAHTRAIVPDSIRTNVQARNFIGSKPPEFCGWLFGLLGMEPEDEFHDLFYGSGAVTKAWEQWRETVLRGGPLFMGR